MRGAAKGFEDAYRGLGLAPKPENLTAITAITAVSRELPDAKALPVDALPKACRRLVSEAAAAIGCPPDFVGLPMLITLASAIGNSRVLKLKEGWEESAALYGAAVADPGEKKTPAQKVAVEPAIKVQAALREKYREKADEYKRELREYEVDKKDAAKNGLAAPPPPEEPVMERTLVEDTTVEALAVVMEHTPRGVLVMRDELAAWVRAMDQYRAAGKGADRQFWLSAWSNSYASVDRKSRGEPLILQRPFSCLSGSIQPDVLPELGAGRDDGLLDRLLFAYPDPAPSRWTDDEISTEARVAYKALYDGLRSLHAYEDDYGDPEPKRVVLAPDSKSVLVEAINQHREEMETPGFPTRLKGPWSKLEAYFARLCLILALARTVDEEVAERVEARDVLSALALLDYFKNHARRVHVGLYGEHPDDQLAEDTANFLRRHGGSWEGQPAELHKQLESDFKPPRPDELSKRLKAIAERTPGLSYDNFDKWVSELKNKRRFLRLTLENGGNGGNGGNGANSGGGS